MHPLTLYLTVFGISLAAWLLLEIWLYLRERAQAPGTTPTEALRSFAALLLAVAFATNVPGIAPMFDVRTNYAAYFWTGSALTWAGLLLRLWSIRVRGSAANSTLVTGGPYRFLRHPSYAAALISLGGLGISLGNGASLALLLVTGLLVYMARVRADEKTLMHAFGGSYEEYRRRTWALIPFVW